MGGAGGSGGREAQTKAPGLGGLRGVVRDSRKSFGGCEDPLLYGDEEEDARFIAAGGTRPTLQAHLTISRVIEHLSFACSLR